MSSIDSTIAAWLTDEPCYHPLVELILHPDFMQVPAPPDRPWDVGLKLYCDNCTCEWRYGYCIPYAAVYCSRCGHSLPPPSEYWY
jgi:hypothetical protein